MVGKTKKDILIRGSMHNLSSFIAESVQKEEAMNNAHIQQQQQVSSSINSIILPSSSPCSSTPQQQAVVSFRSSSTNDGNTEDVMLDCNNNNNNIQVVGPILNNNNNNLIENHHQPVIVLRPPSTTTFKTLSSTLLQQQEMPLSSNHFSSSTSEEILLPPSLNISSRSNSSGSTGDGSGGRHRYKQNLPYDPIAQQISLSQYTLGQSSTNNNSNNNNGTSEIHNDSSKWERKLLEITRAAFVSMLGSKNKRLSEWTLMNQISESLTDITASQFCIIMKAVNVCNSSNSGSSSSGNHSNNSSSSNLSLLNNNTENELHLQVIGSYGIETEAAELFVTHRQKVPIHGTHSIFSHCFNRQQIINLSCTTTNLPPGHLPISNSICIPICYGKESIGTVLLSNRLSGYSEEMETALLAWAQSLGQMLKMYVVLFETETGQQSSFFDMSTPPTPQHRIFRREFESSSTPSFMMHGGVIHPYDNHFRRASISNIQISKPSFLSKLGKSKSGGNVFNDRSSRNSSLSSICTNEDVLVVVEGEGGKKSSLRMDDDLSSSTAADQRVPPNRNYTASPCSSVSSVSDGGHLQEGEDYQDPISLFEEIENEMLKSAELSLALFKAVQDSILILDQNLTVTTMNPSAKKFFGISTNQSPTNSTIPTIIGHMGNGSCQNISVRDLIPDNSTKHLNWSEICKPNGVSWYRGKALAKCRNNTTFVDNTVRTSSSSLFIIDSTLPSPATTVTNYVDILSGTRLSPNSSLNILSTSSSSSEDHPLKKQDTSQDFSRLVPIAISVSSFIFKEEIYYSVTVTDESSKEEMKDKMKFIAYLSHELRNPIQVIVSGVQCLVDIFKDNEESDDMDDMNNGKSIIKSIASSSEFISHIINDMIDLTKLESGHMKLTEASFNIREKVGQIVEMLKIYKVDKNIDISYQIDENVPQSLYSDATKLQQILLNIMSNSCKYTKSGSVRLFCSFENIMEEEGGKLKKNIIFKIQDTGVGIEKEEISKIFRMYRRLHRKQHEVSGSGIGLALSKLLSDILGYTIKVDSEKNVGTTFTVVVPYRLNPNNPTTDTTDSQPEEIKKPTKDIPIEELLKNKRALIVDDNELIRKLVKNMLKMCNCEEAENGLEALKKCEEHEFDFIILDIIMPLVDGFEAAKILRNERKLQTPILALTGNSLQEEIDALLKIGVNKVMIKPIKRLELFSELKDVLS